MDYTITDMDLSSFSAFTVIQQTLLSDHNQTNIYIKTHHTPEQNQLETCNISGPAEIQWTSDSADKFTQELNSEELKNLPIFMNKTFETTKDGVNLATNEINYIFKKAAHLSELKAKNTLRKNTKK